MINNTPMQKLAFCLLHYFPFGGLQRDFLRIATALHERGHLIHVYTLCWEGIPPPWIIVHVIHVRPLQNHTRLHAFIRAVKPLLDQGHYDVVIGFNKMPYLDIYYAADVCLAARIASRKLKWIYRYLPRYRFFLRCEEAVFKHGQPTQILLIAPAQQAAFMKHYQTEATRFHFLSPGIEKNMRTREEAAAIRYRVRADAQLSEEQLLIMLIGSGFKTKGLDRLLFGIAALTQHLKTRCQLFVIGEGSSTPFIRLAKCLKIHEALHFLGGRDDVPDWLLAADLLVHPAIIENTGTVLLEALAAGLPVLTLDHCGYAPYVCSAQAGIVLSSPFKQSVFNETLQQMLQTLKQRSWQQNALAFAHTTNLYGLVDQAADFIEHYGSIA